MMLEHELQQKSTKKFFAVISAECFVSSFRQREFTNKDKEDFKGKDIRHVEMSEDTQQEDSTNNESDQDSSVTFEDDADSTSSQEDELEDWISTQVVMLCVSIFHQILSRFSQCTQT